jgi:cytochrome b561
MSSKKRKLAKPAPKTNPTKTPAKTDRGKFVYVFLLVFSGISLLTAIILYVWFPENRSLFSTVENPEAVAPLWISFLNLAMINLLAGGAAYLFYRRKK